MEQKLMAKLGEAVELGQEAERARLVAEKAAAAAQAALDESVAADAAATFEAYKRGVAAALPARTKAVRLLAAASDEAQVERVIVESRAVAMGDGDLERARAGFTGRGTAPGAAAFLVEGAVPRGAACADEQVDRSDLSAGEMAALCGVVQ
jgi:hypothetical protein